VFHGFYKTKHISILLGRLTYMIIGEASKHIPEDIKKRYPEIPWRLMGDMRNVVTHEYFQVRLKLIWQGINNDIPVLIQQLQNLLEKESQSLQ
jgi:uncharacterized protein with HEPN domain